MKNIVIKPPDIFGNPKYKGKHVALVDNKVVAYGPWKKVSKKVDEIREKTNKIPALTYVPKAGIWIF